MPRRLVLDASTLLAAFLPDEPLHAAAMKWMQGYAAGDFDALAPSLLPYEVANSLLTAERRTSRVSSGEVDVILADLEYLGIELLTVPPTLATETARRYKCSAYDASYIGLAEQQDARVVTADRRLWSTVGQRCHHIQWVEADDE